MLVLSGTASTAVRQLLDGPRLDGTVVATSSRAAYLRVGDDVLALITSDAARVPCAVVLAPASALPADLVPGLPVTVGGGEVTWRAARSAPGAVRPRRSWAPPVVHGGATSAPGAPELAMLRQLDAERPDPFIEDSVRRAAAALSAHDAGGAAGHLVAVLGVGPGLTPSGDDAAAGLLLAARALAVGAGARRRVEAAGRLVAAAARERTTTVSSALLAHAVGGRATTEVVDAVDCLVGRPHPHGLSSTVRFERLLRLGHTSGADTAGGLLAAARHLTSNREPLRPTPPGGVHLRLEAHLEPA